MRKERGLEERETATGEGKQNLPPQICLFGIGII